MTTRILPAVGDPDAARVHHHPAQPAPGRRTGRRRSPTPPQLLDTLARLAAESLDELPEVVLVHERIGPVPALELIREVALRFPAVGVVLVTADAEPRPLLRRHGLRRARPGRPAARLRGTRRTASRPRPQLVGRRTAPPRPAAATCSPAPAAPSSPSAAPRAASAPPSPPSNSPSPPRRPGRTVALVDLDLQSGDVASYLDVQFRRSVADLAAITDISPARPARTRVFTPRHRARRCCSRPARANAARRSPTGRPARSSARCAPATRSSSSTAAPR